MTSQMKDMLENIESASALAQREKRVVYAFNDQGVWGFSGKLPESLNSYYVLYPNGEIDKSNLPQVTLTRETQPQSTTPVTAEEKGLLSNLMKKSWKIFIGYCAFAPFVALSLTLLFSQAIPNFQNVLNFAFFSCMFCLPLSAVFALISLVRPKSAWISTFCSILATDAHSLFYVCLWLVCQQGLDPMILFFGTMGSIIMSGLALLFIWDNERAKEPELKEFS